MTQNTLSAYLQSNRVENFDPRNRKHLVAFAYLTKHGRQLPGQRFNLEHPYTNIRSLMEAKVCEMFLATRPDIEKEANAILSGETPAVAESTQAFKLKRVN